MQKHRGDTRSIRETRRTGTRLRSRGTAFKTAVAAVLGYECSAYDDLQDAWAEGDAGRKFVEALAAMFQPQLRRRRQSLFGRLRMSTSTS